MAGCGVHMSEASATKATKALLDGDLLQRPEWHLQASFSQMTASQLMGGLYAEHVHVFLIPFARRTFPGVYGGAHLQAVANRLRYVYHVHSIPGWTGSAPNSPERVDQRDWVNKSQN